MKKYILHAGKYIVQQNGIKIHEKHCKAPEKLSKINLLCHSAPHSQRRVTLCRETEKRIQSV